MTQDEKEFDLDATLDNEIKFGKYQMLIFVLIALPLTLNGIFSNAYIFTAGILNYRCEIPQCEDDTGHFITPWLNFSTPFTSNLPEKCSKYEELSGDNGTACSSDSFNRSVIVECRDTFIYEDDEITIQNQFDLTCNKEFYLSLIGTINNVGQLFCYLITGVLSDSADATSSTKFFTSFIRRYGRKIVLIVGTLGSGVFGVLRAFATNYIQFAIFEFLDALFGASTFASAFIIGLELVTPRYRTISGIVLNCFYAIGCIFLGLIAMWFKDYKSVLLITYLPSFIIISYTCLLPQSIRWLFSKERHDEARQILWKACKMNGTAMSQQTLDSLHEKIEIKDEEAKAVESGTVRTSWRAQISMRALMQIANLAYCWFAVVFVYYGLNLNSVYLEYWNKYINFIFVSAIELPGYFITHFFMERLGRKRTLFLGLMGSGIFCILAEYVPGVSAKTISYVSGKLLITIAFTCLYIYTVEVFPTNLRHRFFSICSVVGRIGSTLAPLTPLLIQLSPSLPLILFAVFSFSSSLLLCHLPETHNKKLPENVDEAFN